MPRSIWNGLISFGMVSIPVKLFTATESKDISFHLLHKECNSRLKQLRWCPACEREVEWGETVRGYEVAKGEYLIVEDEELEAIEIESTHTIEIDSFVPRAQIDQRFFDSPYYVTPNEPAGQEAFAVIRDAMRSKGMVALGRLVLT